MDNYATVFSPPLHPGTLIRRSKRFLAYVNLDDGPEVIAHCMNTGSMMGLTEPGSRVWLSPQDKPNRKLKWTWEIASQGDVLVNVNTSAPNRIAAEVIQANRISSLAGYRSLRREVRYGTNSRIDILLEDHPDDPRPCYVELKNVTLVENDCAMFPDAVTARGLKHLHELAGMVKEGARSVLFFFVSRADVRSFRAATHIDPKYSEALAQVSKQGVEICAWTFPPSPQSIGLGREIPILLDPP